MVHEVSCFEKWHVNAWVVYSWTSGWWPIRLTPRSEQDRISPYSIKITLSRHVMTIKEKNQLKDDWLILFKIFWTNIIKFIWVWIYENHIYVYHQTDLLPVGLSAQLDKSTALESQRSWIQIPYRPKFFSDLIFSTANYKMCSLLCRIICINLRIVWQVCSLEVKYMIV